MKLTGWTMTAVAAVFAVGTAAGAAVAGPPSGSISLDGGRTYVTPKTDFGKVIRRYPGNQNVEASVKGGPSIRGPKGGPYIYNDGRGNVKPYRPGVGLVR